MNTNKNALRSKKWIRNAFIELIEEKGNVEKISVKEIIQKADISKSTFYAHYQDIYSVIEEFENELINIITSSIDQYFTDKNRDATPYIQYLLKIFKENEELYKKLFVGDSSFIFINKVKQLVSFEMENFISKELTIKNQKKFDFYVKYMTNGIIYLIVDYFRRDSNLSLEEIATESCVMCDNILKLIKAKQPNLNETKY